MHVYETHTCELYELYERHELVSSDDHECPPFNPASQLNECLHF
jgi:hypothetical protein